MRCVLVTPGTNTEPQWLQVVFARHFGILLPWRDACCRAAVESSLARPAAPAALILTARLAKKDAERSPSPFVSAILFLLSLQLYYQILDFYFSES